MKIIITTILSFCIFSSLFGQLDTSVTIGNQKSFTQVNDSVYGFPTVFNLEGYSGSRQQYLYSSNEYYPTSFRWFRIKKIAFYIETLNDSVLDEITLSYGFVPATFTFLNSWKLRGFIGEKTSHSIYLKKGWNEFELDTTNIQWKNDPNKLVINICAFDSSRTQNTFAYNTTVNSSALCTNDSQKVCSSQSLTLGNDYHRPDIRITYEVRKGPTSIDKIQDFQNEIALYPNPVVNELQLSITYKTKYNLYDFTGRLLKTGEVSSEVNTIDMQSLAPGSYILHLEQNGNPTTVKFIKE